MKKQLSYIAAAFFISGMLSAQNIDLNAMPKPGPTPVINIAKPKTFQLKNGLQVLVVENNKLPRVNVTLSIDRPPYYEGNIAGVSDIMASQLDNGTTSLSKEEFNKKVDFLGANLNFSANGAFANTLSKYFPEVLGLMADAIVNPKFDAKEISDAKERTIEGLKADEKNASAIASRVSNALMYGKNTARGEFETEESIAKITLADVQNVYKKNYVPDNAYLVIVGDVQYDEVKKLVEKAFKNWKKANTKYAPLEPAANVASTEIDVVDVPSAVQSVVSVNNLNTLKMGDPNYFPAVMANYILGGGGEARLFMNLREKNGFTYGAYSSMTASKYAPEFSAEASVRNEVTDKAVQEFMNELNAISTVKPEELANAKAKMKGNFIMSLEKPETVAKFALNQKLNNLPDDFYTNYLKSIDKVTAADVTKAVNATIFPKQSRIFVAGKASEISESLEKLGYPVKYFDKNANPVAKPAAQKVDASVTVAKIGENYINAIGGLAAVQKVNSVTTSATANVQGMEVNMKMIETNKGQKNIDVQLMGNSVQKIVFDGKDGYMSGQGQKIAMTDEMKAEFLGEKSIFPELGYAASKDYTVSGVESFNGEDAYVVKGPKETSYYSVKTGLKTGSVKSQKMGGQEVKVPTTYADYKEVSGVKFPFSFTTNMSGMDVTFNVSAVELNKATDADFK